MEETGGKPGRGKRCEKRAAMTGSLRETGEVTWYICCGIGAPASGTPG